MRFHFLFVLLLGHFLVNGKTIYVNQLSGSNTSSGLTSHQALSSIDDAMSLKFHPGDSLLFACGQTFAGMIAFHGFQGSSELPLLISSYEVEGEKQPATIDGKGYESAIRLINCKGVKISNLRLTADGGSETIPSKGVGMMRCGLLFLVNAAGDYGDLKVDSVHIYDIYYPESGFNRGKDDVKTANGSQPYGWGIRVINSTSESQISNVSVSNSLLENVGHTGIKFTSSKDWSKHLIRDIVLNGNHVLHSGGPGIQMSGISKAHVFSNTVNYSGSVTDSRKWGRGSGLWTWGSDDVLVEKNRFLNANGPGDSAGAHIDFNCNNIVLQYNLSMDNAGGFCEILGNNFNCCYRYNISINDGHRVKGKDDAFQEGKIFWLSGYSGKKKKRSGPFNSYFYNNTIYVSKNIQAKIAVDKTSSGILIANNIFHFEGESSLVLGDQYKPEKLSEGGTEIENVLFSNNLFLNDGSWPAEVIVQPENSIFGDVGLSIEDFDMLDFSGMIPMNADLVKSKGIKISPIGNDDIGITIGLQVESDFLGNAVSSIPGLGAIEVK